MKNILILGVDGFIGNALYNKLKTQQDFQVDGTSRKTNSEYLFLDLNNEQTNSNIIWEKYDLVYCCIGSINYGSSIDSLVSNIQTNVVDTLKIFKKLKPHQKLVYLSTHVSKLELKDHNSYSFSKYMFENSAEVLENNENLKIVRVPGIFSSKRKQGLFHNLQKAFKDNDEFTFNFDPKKWHIMELERLVDILSIFSHKEVKEKVLDIAYPLEISMRIIYQAFKDYFKKDIVFIGDKDKKEDYLPDVQTLLQYYSIEKEDFQKDVHKYLGESKCNI